MNHEFENRCFYIGDIVQYYKRKELSDEFKNIHKRKYLYSVLSVPYNAELKQREVVLQSLETGDIISLSEKTFCSKCEDEDTYLFEGFL